MVGGGGESGVRVVILEGMWWMEAVRWKASFSGRNWVVGGVDESKRW